MENPEEILHSLEEFTKLKPKDIPRELEDYLCFVAKTGDPVYQWAIVKSLFKEKLVSVITDFYETCPSIDVPPCPNVEVFNYETMKSFILEKLDTFAAAPFTVQRICELLTTPRKEYNRIDKYMRALEKNILVVSTTEPLVRRLAGNGDIVNGLETDHIVEVNSSNDINVEEIDEAPVWSHITNETVSYMNESEVEVDISTQSEFISETHSEPVVGDSVICRPDNQPFVSIKPVEPDNCVSAESVIETDTTVTITAIPAAVQNRRNSIEPIVSTVEEENAEVQAVEIEISLDSKEDVEMNSPPPSEPVSTPSPKDALPIIKISELSPSEAEPSIIESSNIPLEIPTHIARIESAQATEESTPLIQIPVISEITSEVDNDLDAEASIQSPILNLQEDSNSDESTVLSEPSEEVSTSTPEPVSADSQTNFENVSVITKDTTVSSTDDLNSDIITNLKCDRTLEESCSSEELLTETVDTSSEAEEKQTETVPSCDIQEFASSSTISEAIDINIEEETCQEAPTFNR